MDINIPNKTQIKPVDLTKLNAAEINLMVAGINSKADKETVNELSELVDEFINQEEQFNYVEADGNGYLNI